jgi:hypothetical protein
LLLLKKLLNRSQLLGIPANALRLPLCAFQLAVTIVSIQSFYLLSLLSFDSSRASHLALIIYGIPPRIIKSPL